MSEGTRPADGERPMPTVETAALGLLFESLSLATVLLASLAVAVGERLGFIPGSGYASSLVLLALSIRHWRHYAIHVRLLPVRSGHWWLPLTFVVALIAALLLSAWVPLAPQVGGKPPTVLQIIHLLALVPLAEEVYFRGLLLEHLRRGFGPIRAVLLCSFLFAILHQPAGAGLVAGFLSLAACLLVLKGRALVYAVQLHVLWNGLSQIHRVDDASVRWSCAVFASVVILTLACSGLLKRERRASGGKPE